MVPDLVQQRPYLKGIIGTNPVSTDGALYDSFQAVWKNADPMVYYGAGIDSRLLPVNRVFCIIAHMKMISVILTVTFR